MKSNSIEERTLLLRADDIKPLSYPFECNISDNGEINWLGTGYFFSIGACSVIEVAFAINSETFGVDVGYSSAYVADMMNIPFSFQVQLLLEH